jgi:tRNA A-37 threonylcarbamoyl transferase component Bud32
MLPLAATLCAEGIRPPARLAAKAMAMTVTPAEAMRKLRADPTFRQKELARQRQYYRRNRDAIRYVAKCRQAGIDMTMAKAREILCQPGEA